MGMTDSDLQALAVREAIRRAQALVADYVDPDISLSEELIRERHEACEAETMEPVEST